MVASIHPGGQPLLGTPDIMAGLTAVHRNGGKGDSQAGFTRLKLQVKVAQHLVFGPSIACVHERCEVLTVTV